MVWEGIGGGSLDWQRDLSNDGVGGGATRHLFGEMPSHQAATAGGVLRITVSHVLYPVTKEVLHHILEVYGVEKMFVFEKGNHVEAMVQLRSWQEAKRARDAFHGRCIYEGSCFLDILLVQPTPDSASTTTARRGVEASALATEVVVDAHCSPLDTHVADADEPMSEPVPSPSLDWDWEAMSDEQKDRCLRMVTELNETLRNRLGRSTPSPTLCDAQATSTVNAPPVMVLQRDIVPDGTHSSDLTSTPSGAAANYVDCGNELNRGCLLCLHDTRKLFDGMPVRSTVVLWPPPVKGVGRSLWPFLSKAQGICCGAEARSMSWPSFGYGREGEQLKQPWPPPIQFLSGVFAEVVFWMVKGYACQDTKMLNEKIESLGAKFKEQIYSGNKLQEMPRWIETHASNLCSLDIMSTVELLKRCLADGPYWPVIKDILQVHGYSTDSSYIYYSMSPYIFESNVSTEEIYMEENTADSDNFDNASTESRTTNQEDVSISEGSAAAAWDLVRILHHGKSLAQLQKLLFMSSIEIKPWPPPLLKRIEVIRVAQQKLGVQYTDPSSLAHTIGTFSPYWDHLDGSMLLPKCLRIQAKNLVLVGDALQLVVQNSATMVAGLVIAFVLNWEFSLMILTLLPLIGLNEWIRMKFIQGFSADAKMLYEEASQVANDAVSSIRIVALFSSEEKVMDLYKKKCEGPLRTGIRTGIISGIGFGVSFFLLFGVYAASFYAGARLVEDEKTTFPNGFRVFLAVAMAAIGVSQSSTLTSDSSKVQSTASSIFAIVDRKSRIDPSEDAWVTAETLRGIIEFQHVSFRYPTRPDVEIFRDLCLTIHSRKTVALVGESGSGKSTAISLLQRFHDPDVGHILLDGVDIQKFQLRWLRQQMGLVSPEPALFNDTIRANLVGVKSVTSHDDGNVELWDLSSNFFLSEKDVGQNRAQACVQKLQELNNAVFVSTLTGELTKVHLSNCQAVVFIDISLEKAIEFDDYRHSHQPHIAFIKSEVCGLSSSVFCDFGPGFTVLVVDGEEPHTGIVTLISNDNTALVSCVYDEHLGFQDGDLVVFSEVQGMTELNGVKPRKIKNARAYSFTLEEDTSSFGTYGGAIVTQVKPPKVLKFKPMKEAMKEQGEFLMTDFSRAVLILMTAMFGGIVGQEVVKACSGKFHPIYQFFYFDSVESLPVEPLEAGDLKLENSRYDAQISVFESKLQQKLEQAKIFATAWGQAEFQRGRNVTIGLIAGPTTSLLHGPWWTLGCPEHPEQELSEATEGTSKKTDQPKASSSF